MAHERGLVHRDVKPGNVMLTPVGAKLIDFGISAVEGESEAQANGGFRGTPAYVAPERLRGQAVASPSDVYALGVLLYQALCGHQPSEPGPARVALPSDLGLPSEVGDVCRQCLAADPDDRPNASTVARVLAEAAGPEGIRDVESLAADRDETGPATELMAPLSTRDYYPGRRAAIIRFAAAAAGLLAVFGVGWSAVRWSPFGDAVIPETFSATGPAGPQEPACALTFRLTGDDGTRFTADVAATPKAESIDAGWTISFPMPADGVNIDPASGWTRVGTVLTSAAQPALGLGQTHQVPLAGAHSGMLAIPTRMTMDGHDCAVDVFTATAPPAALVAQPESATGPAAAKSPSTRAAESPERSGPSQAGAKAQIATVAAITAGPR